jgi:hypothetical protein
MPKWADYCITRKRMNSKGTHIDFVEVYPDLVESFGAVTTKSRAQVVADLKIGVTYITIYKNAQDKWQRGETVIIDKVKGVEYIKTLPDKIEADNLDKLPDF